jgi:hypothetical protein
MPQVDMPLLADVRSTIILAFKALPLLLISFIGFLAVGLCNLSLFVLFLGHAIIVPILTEACHSIPNTGALMTPNDISQLVPLIPTTGASYSSPINSSPSYWMAHVSFFFGYILMNAISIYNMPAEKNAIEWMITSRKTRAVTIITTTVILWVLFAYMRYSFTGVETFGGIALAMVLLGGAGVGWYYLASALGARNSDIFGIAQSMMSQNSGNAKPVTCVYSPKP